MTSRLDRLFVLLESGSSAATRSAAAKQLGEVQRLHPHELHTLLGRITSLLRAPAWDTRVAAAQAVAAVLSATPQWDPIPIEVKKEELDDYKVSQVARLRVNQLDIAKVLTNSTHLMGSEGKEYDLDDTCSTVDYKEKLARQRQQLNARLGLDVASKIGIDFSSIFNNEDLVINVSDNKDILHNNDNSITRRPILEVMQEVTGNDTTASNLSCREMNRARRKARQAVSKQRSRDPLTEESPAGISDFSEVHVSKKPKIELESTSKVKEEFPVFIDSTPDATGSWGANAVEWPLDSFCESLCANLFSTSWEARHGSATALREVLRTHGKGAGRVAYSTADEMTLQHHLWLEDIATRLLCVLALDRFGDFVSDAVVAPVRETAAQCLGATLKLMPSNTVEEVLNVLLQLLTQKEWEARHGGLLGLKYLLAIREDMVHSLLPKSFNSILCGLSDPVDDVGAVAAAALIPVSEALVRLLPQSIAPVVSRLWELLGEQDELAAACNSFMGLLAAILSLPASQSFLPPTPLYEVVPRLWPFLYHSTSTVRRATLQTLRTLTSSTAPRLVNNSCVQIQWTAELLQDALRHIFQRVLIEHIEDVQDIVEQVWNNLIKNSGLAELLHAACPYVSTWICLTMQPVKLPFDSNMLIHAKTMKERKNKSANGLELPGGSLQITGNLDVGLESLINAQQKWFIGGSETIPLSTRESNVMRARCLAAKMLGLLSSYIVKPAPGIIYTSEMESPIDCYVKVLLVYLQSKSAVQRMMASLVVMEWARVDSVTTQPCPELLRQRLHICLSECVYFDEIGVAFTRLLQETKDFIATLKHYRVCPENFSNANVLTLEQMSTLSGPDTATILANARLKPKVLTSLEERRRTILSSAQTTAKEQQMFNISTLSTLAGASTMLHALPEKLNPVVRPLMEAIKREEETKLQELAAIALAHLADQCILREPCPNAKIIANLCTLLCSDPDFTPKIITNQITHDAPSSDSGVEDNSRATTPVTLPDQLAGILTLTNQQRSAERAAFRRSNSSTGRGPGRPPATDVPLEELFSVEDETQKANRIQRRGATLALIAVAEYFGANLPTKLPKLWELSIGQLTEIININLFDPNSLVNNPTAAEVLVAALQILEVCAPAFHESLLPTARDAALPRLACLLAHPYRAVRYLASRCLATFAKLCPVDVMQLVVDKILHLLDASHCNTHRQGAVEAIACIVDALQFDIVPYVVLLVVPLLGRMSDQNESVRLMATHSFATLVQLMPLDGAVPEPPTLSISLKGQRDREREFLKQLLSPNTIPDYVVSIPINAQLRSYQQSGINWLAFLNKYKLHGILCDDMGLGKTLQSICMLASDHYQRDKIFKKTHNVDCAPLPSLVICPPTLTGHWVYEVEKFLSNKYLRPLQYVGPPIEREKLRHKFKTHNLIVASYEIVRKDIDFFSSIKWNYCILDEGHIIKNGKTKSSKAIKLLTANHRLILSGTPIQNNVLELWSLFDFLMPGFLGTEKQFTAKFSRPILASRDPKCSSKEQEAGALSMEALHRQVLPFLLRRMKEDVLDDLPPKITQDYYCELSPLQEQLYEDFSRSQAHQSLQDSLQQKSVHGGTETNNAIGGSTHIFQALRYLQNVCNHPKLVLSSSHPLYSRIIGQGVNLSNIEHAAKLPALKQLLLDLGIGTCPSTTNNSTSADLVINQHRALVFCQLKVMLDILEKDLFKVHLPGVAYLRLDGSVPPPQRHALVTRFNNDPSIDVLLLTTQVGGLGLNLTGADTVIFVEHDWNPTRDLQAMDRAHRIGQRRVVNVYRLITRHTLEEKIMGLQKFKLLTANTVISSENSSLNTMGTGDLLDLFSNQPGTANTLPVTTQPQDSTSMFGLQGPASLKTVLESLPDLWDHKQYEEEYDLTQFVRNLRN